MCVLGMDVCAGEGVICPMLVSVRRYSCTRVISFQVVGLFLLLLFLKLAIWQTCREFSKKENDDDTRFQRSKLSSRLLRPHLECGSRSVTVLVQRIYSNQPEILFSFWRSHAVQNFQPSRAWGGKKVKHGNAQPQVFKHSKEGKPFLISPNISQILRGIVAKALDNPHSNCSNLMWRQSIGTGRHR